MPQVQVLKRTSRNSFIKLYTKLSHGVLVEYRTNKRMQPKACNEVTAQSINRTDAVIKECKNILDRINILK